ncbi:class I SAM-dependent methyltransferase [Nocardia jejuensis]|uniref:class I SAM-dependent methyltransferase n=1 Tax=Nocardia jejuensis TaxID=328049 RepID=UPI00082D746F|nr:methyltransferase domain-containing protein [Nocardia jejuensis]
MSQSPLASSGPWDEVAERYDDAATEVMRPFSAHALALAELSPGAHVVDVAAGPGTLAIPAAARVARVSALDFSPLMIERLVRHAEAAGLDAIDARVGDGQALPYAEDSFDAGFSLFGLMFFPDRARGFAELHRVLRPGAIAVVSSWAPLADSSLMTLLSGAFQAGIPGYPAPQPNPENLENPEVFEAELRAAGFTEVSVRAHTESFAYDSAEQLWDRLTRGSAPLQLARSRFDEETWKAQEHTMIEYLAARYEPNRPLTTTAYLGTGRK